MYSVSDERHLSNRDGRLLANTASQAFELQNLFETDTLKTRYHVIDKLGNSSFYTYGDKKEALEHFKKQILLTSKYISKKEKKALEVNGFIS